MLVIEVDSISKSSRLLHTGKCAFLYQLPSGPSFFEINRPSNQKSQI